MAFAFICDICGKYFDGKIETTQGIKGNVIKIGHIPPEARFRPDTLEQYDACPNCIAATRALFKALKADAEEEKPETPTPEEGDQNELEHLQ